MIVQLTELARVRLLLEDTTPGMIPTDVLIVQVDGHPSAVVNNCNVTVEAFVPRGARAEYALIKMSYELGHGDAVVVEVGWTEERGQLWPDSLAGNLDEVRTGLPREYARSTLEAMATFARGRFPPGAVRVTGAAHGAAGSSKRIFSKIAMAAMFVMLSTIPIQEETVRNEMRRLLVE